MDNETHSELVHRERAGTLLAGSGSEPAGVEVWAPDERRLRREAVAGGAALAYFLCFEGFVFWDAIARGIASHPSLFWVFVLMAIGILPATVALARWCHAIPGLLRRRYVAADSQGFSAVGWRGAQALPWSEVTGCSYQRINNTVFLYTVSGKRVYINLAGFDPAALEVLLARIRECGALSCAVPSSPVLGAGQRIWARPGYRPNSLVALCPGAGKMVATAGPPSLPGQRVTAGKLTGPKPQ